MRDIDAKVLSVPSSNESVKPVGTEERESIRIHTRSLLNISLKDLGKLLMGYRCSLSLCLKVEMKKGHDSNVWDDARVTKYSVKINVHKRGEAIPTKKAIFDDKDLHK